MPVKYKPNAVFSSVFRPKKFPSWRTTSDEARAPNSVTDATDASCVALYPFSPKTRSAEEVDPMSYPNNIPAAADPAKDPNQGGTFEVETDVAIKTDFLRPEMTSLSPFNPRKLLFEDTLNPPPAIPKLKHILFPQSRCLALPSDRPEQLQAARTHYDRKHGGSSDMEEEKQLECRETRARRPSKQRPTPQETTHINKQQQYRRPLRCGKSNFSTNNSAAVQRNKLDSSVSISATNRIEDKTISGNIRFVVKGWFVPCMETKSSRRTFVVLENVPRLHNLTRLLQCVRLPFLLYLSLQDATLPKLRKMTMSFFDRHKKFTGRTDKRSNLATGDLLRSGRMICGGWHKDIASKNVASAWLLLQARTLCKPLVSVLSLSFFFSFSDLKL